MSFFEQTNTNQRITAWKGDLPVQSLYTAGIAGERFLRSLKDKKILEGTHCEECEVTYMPAKLFCERCLAELSDYVEVGPTGYVASMALAMKDLDDKPLESPILYALIGFDGVDGFLIHVLGEIDPDDLAVGTLVEPVWASTREGSITDIQYFRPVS